MKRISYIPKTSDNPKGIIEKELSLDEITNYAKLGDLECRKEIFNKKLKVLDETLKNNELINAKINLIITFILGEDITK